MDDKINVHYCCLMNILNKNAYYYEPLMSKKDYNTARNEIKHFLWHDADLVKPEEYPQFDKYCNKVFNSYIKNYSS